MHNENQRKNNGKDIINQEYCALKKKPKSQGAGLQKNNQRKNKINKFTPAQLAVVVNMDKINDMKWQPVAPVTEKSK